MELGWSTIDNFLIKIAAAPIKKEAAKAVIIKKLISINPGLIIIRAPTNEKIIAKKRLCLIFSLSRKIANIAPKTGAVKLMAVAFAKGIFDIEKNHKYIAAKANKDLYICKRYELVLRLFIPSLNIQGSIKTTAKNDLKNIICVK